MYIFHPVYPHIPQVLYILMLQKILSPTVSPLTIPVTIHVLRPSGLLSRLIFPFRCYTPNYNSFPNLKPSPFFYLLFHHFPHMIGRILLYTSLSLLLPYNNILLSSPAAILLKIFPSLRLKTIPINNRHTHTAFLNILHTLNLLLPVCRSIPVIARYGISLLLRIQTLLSNMLFLKNNPCKNIRLPSAPLLTVSMRKKLLLR